MDERFSRPVRRPVFCCGAGVEGVGDVEGLVELVDGLGGPSNRTGCEHTFSLDQDGYSRATQEMSE
jgi:hypothetical protein